MVAAVLTLNSIQAPELIAGYLIRGSVKNNKLSKDNSTQKTSDLPRDSFSSNPQRTVKPPSGFQRANPLTILRLNTKLNKITELDVLKSKESEGKIKEEGKKSPRSKCSKRSPGEANEGKSTLEGINKLPINSKMRQDSEISDLLSKSHPKAMEIITKPKKPQVRIKKENQLENSKDSDHGSPKEGGDESSVGLKSLDDSESFDQLEQGLPVLPQFEKQTLEPRMQIVLPKSRFPRIDLNQVQLHKNQKGE